MFKWGDGRRGRKAEDAEETQLCWPADLERGVAGVYNQAGRIDMK